MTPSRPPARSPARSRWRRLAVLLAGAWVVAVAFGVIDGANAAFLALVAVLGAAVAKEAYALAPGHGAAAERRDGYRTNDASSASEAVTTLNEPERERTQDERWKAHWQVLLLVIAAALCLLMLAINSDWNSPGRGPAGADFSINGLGTTLVSLACSVFLFFYATITTLIVAARSQASAREIAAMHLSVAVALVVAAVFGLICL